MRQGPVALPDEMRLLLLGARPWRADVDRAAVHALLRRPLDWTAFVASALRHGVAAQVFARLLAVARSELPPELVDAAQTHIDEQRSRNGRLIGQLMSVLDALERAGIDAIPIKGPLLAQLLYEDASLRAATDLDLLLRRADAERALHVLGALGYRPYPEAPPLTPRQERAIAQLAGQAVLWRPGAPAAIEPHWSLVPGNLRLALDYESLWRRAHRIPFAERMVPSLALEDQLLVIAVHGGKDEWSKLQALADLAQAIERYAALDWRSVLERAQAQRCRRMLLAGMALAERLLETPLPDAIAEACARDPRLDGLVERMMAQLIHRGPTQNSIFALSTGRWRLHDRWRDRVGYAAATLLAPREQHFAMVPLPDRLFFAYYGVKIGHDYLLWPIWIMLKRLGVVAPSARESVREPAS